MLATKKGIEINREELWALLSFTGDSEQYSVVHARVNGSGKLEMAATDGKRSVECVAKSDGAEPFEVAIDAAFLKKCKDAIDGKHGESLLIRLKDAGLKDALVVDKESGKTVAPIGWNRDAATTQVTMTEVVRSLRVPNDADHTGSWCAIDPDVLSGLTRVRVATDGCPVTLYPPKEPTLPMHFECRSDGGHWKGAITPEKVIAPGGEADEPEDEDETAPGRPDRQTKLDLEDRRAKKDTGVGDGTRHECPGFDGKGCVFSAKDGHKLCPGCEAKADKLADGDDTVIDDEEAKRIKAEAAGKAPEKKPRKIQKRKKAGS